MYNRDTGGRCKGGIHLTDNINKKIDNEAVDLEKLEEVNGGIKRPNIKIPRYSGMSSEALDTPITGKLSLEEMNDPEFALNKLNENSELYMKMKEIAKE